MGSTKLLSRLALLPLLLLAQQSSQASHVAANNISSFRSDEVFQPEDRHGKAFGRFLKFSMDSQDSLNIKLKLSVPFLTVPLRSNDPSKPSAPVELNVRGLLLAAGLGAVAAVLVPALTSSPGPLELPSSWSGK